MSKLQEASYIYKTVNGPSGDQTIDARVVFGESGPPERAIAVWFHGGGFTTGNNNMIAPWQLELLVKDGFVVVCPNYRLTPTVSLAEGPIADSVDSYHWARTTLPSLIKDEHGIQLDPTKTVTLGHSCGGGLALFMGGQSPPPRAIVDFYGMKYFHDAFWSTPNPALAQIPDFEPSFLARVWEELPAPTNTPPPFGPTGPDFSKPRNAFMFDGNKKGTYIRSIMKNDDYGAVDSSPLLSKPGFPPVFMLQGTDDSVAPYKLSLQASEALQKAGNSVELRVVQSGAHAFDMHAKPGDDAYRLVESAYAFLKDQVA